MRGMVERESISGRRVKYKEEVLVELEGNGVAGGGGGGGGDE